MLIAICATYLKYLKRNIIRSICYVIVLQIISLQATKRDTTTTTIVPIIITRPVPYAKQLKFFPHAVRPPEKTPSSIINYKCISNPGLTSSSGLTIFQRLMPAWGSIPPIIPPPTKLKRGRQTPAAEACCKTGTHRQVCGHRYFTKRRVVGSSDSTLNWPKFSPTPLLGIEIDE